MSKTDFFRMLIKSIGLFFLITVSLTYFPIIIGFFISGFEWQTILLLFGGLCFLGLIYFFLIIETDIIIHYLKLNKGFDDSKIDLGNLTKQTLFQLAIVIVGIIIMFGFFSDLISFIQFELNKFGNQMNPYLIASIIKFILASIIVIKNKKVAALLLK